MTGATGNDAVILMLSGERGTAAAAVLEALDAAPEVPAAHALAEVAAERAHVAERGAAHGFGR